MAVRVEVIVKIVPSTDIPELRAVLGLRIIVGSLLKTTVPLLLL
jgi:hypothetical protein